MGQPRAVLRESGLSSTVAQTWLFGVMCERFSLTYGRSWTWWDCLASKCESRRLPELRVEAPLRDLREDDQLLRSVDLRCEAERGRFRGIASREAWRPMESRPR